MNGSTIFALASGAGRAGVAVFRLSGPDAGRALQMLSGRALPAPRRACRCLLRNVTGEPLDDGLVLWFPGPASFTGDDVVELHLHGGRAVAQGITDALVALGLRPAEPGEFSRRAFEAGKLDLTQAEAIADLVDADTAAQRRQALSQMGGALGRLYEDWRGRLLRAQAHVEAEIDFSDEDLPGGLGLAASRALQEVAAEISTHLADGGRGERLRDGLHVAIVGAPNVGKSSLLNCLAGRDVAIVSATAGTTRDVLEVHLDLGGYPVTLADTAGLRDTTEEIEREGVRRARLRADHADLRLVVFDGTCLPQLDPDSVAMIDDASLVVVNKVDCVVAGCPRAVGGQPVLGVSAATGAGVERLLAALQERAGAVLDGGGAPAVTRARHRAALQEAVTAIGRARVASLPELAAEDVRLAVRAIGRITGRVDVEDMLDLVFSEFCIGK